MELHGRSIIGGEPSANREDEPFRAYDPSLGRQLEPPYYEANETDIEQAFELADSAFNVYRHKPAKEIAGFLESIADQIPKGSFHAGAIQGQFGWS